MKHSGKARRAARRLVFGTLLALAIIFVAGIAATIVGSFIAAISFTLVAAWLLFAVFTLYFFRDPEPTVPSRPDVIVSPAHGKVDLIDEVEEVEFMGGRCKRVSIFLSVIDVHVQNAPVAGKIVHFKHCPGQYLNAMKADSAVQNENVMIGLESKERPDEKIGVRLIAGMIARRIVPWIQLGDEVLRGERISLIQFGSRVDIYLPPAAQVAVKLGDKVRGGETVIAYRE